MPFVVIEGFSGTGKTTLSKGLEKMGWLRLAESAHVVPKSVPVADRADTFADFSLVGATLEYSSLIAASRPRRRIVAEGYLLSDLSYARIRYDLGKSDAFPALLALVKRVLAEPRLRPDLYIMLKAGQDTIIGRQERKNLRERNLSEFFQTRYYTAIDELHSRLGEDKVEVVFTDSDLQQTLGTVVSLLRRRKLIKG